MFNFYFKVNKLYATAFVLALITSALIVFTGNKNAQFSVPASDVSEKNLSKSFLIKGKNKHTAIAKVGGLITHELKLIDAIAANLSKKQFQQISKMGVQISPNLAVSSAGFSLGPKNWFFPVVGRSNE